MPIARTSSAERAGAEPLTARKGKMRLAARLLRFWYLLSALCQWSWDVVGVRGIGTLLPQGTPATGLEFAQGVERRLAIGKGVAEASQSLCRYWNQLLTVSAASTASKMPVLVNSKGASPFLNISDSSCMACARTPSCLPSLVAGVSHRIRRPLRWRR